MTSILPRFLPPPVCRGAAAVLTMGLTAAPAAAHDWYDAVCCSGEDCAELSFDAVGQTTEGYVLSIEPQSHPTVNGGGQTWKVPYGSSRIRPSQDGNFHACVLKKSQRLACLYVPYSG